MSGRQCHLIQLTILKRYCNIRGLNTEKLLALKYEIEGHFDLVAVTETLLCKTKTLDLSLNGFLPIFRKDRGQGAVPWGGVALYVNENIIAKRKTEFEIYSLVILCIELVTKRKQLLFVCVTVPLILVYFLGPVTTCV